MGSAPPAAVLRTVGSSSPGCCRSREPVLARQLAVQAEGHRAAGLQCFLPTTRCQLCLHGGPCQVPRWVLAPGSPSWAWLPAWHAGVLSWVPPGQRPRNPHCFAALREQLKESGSARRKLGCSSAGGCAGWLRVCSPDNTCRRRHGLTAQPSSWCRHQCHPGDSQLLPCSVSYCVLVSFVPSLDDLHMYTLQITW